MVKQCGRLGCHNNVTIHKRGRGEVSYRRLHTLQMAVLLCRMRQCRSLLGLLVCLASRMRVGPTLQFWTFAGEISIKCYVNVDRKSILVDDLGSWIARTPMFIARQCLAGVHVRHGHVFVGLGEVGSGRKDLQQGLAILHRTCSLTDLPLSSSRHSPYCSDSPVAYSIYSARYYSCRVVVRHYCN